MKEYKRLKDPIYGYINIPVTYMTDIIDTAVFQRLRRVIQTSYSPLYSSALHNRFVHSLGVFYLGELAGRQLVAEIEKKEIPVTFELEKVGEIFKLACLLHDVGHAPFSHTGEFFYLREDGDYTELHKRLSEAIGNPEFEKDVPKTNSSAAAPHEIMSAVIGLSEYEEFFTDVSQREFFARCITGYKYKDNSEENSLRNCFVSLLNSKVIDVDRLDYLIRDAYVTGFDTVNIDFERLLSALTVSSDNENYEIAYYKNAISVIENVVYAHDAERKWIQNHPVVLYESYILQHIIGHLSKRMDEKGKKLFSVETLGKTGETFSGGVSVSLLCDDDIIFLMKNVYPNELSGEFFERRLRRHPVWKSEAEYKAFILRFATGGSLLDRFERAMEATAKYLAKSTDSWVIDDSMIEKLEKELEALDVTELDAKTKKVQRETKNSILKVVKCLQDYAKEKEMECNFVILMVSQFNSGFGKPDFSETNIVFTTNEGEEIAKVGEIVSSLKAKERERDNFFYLFYKRKENAETKETEVDNQEICNRLFKTFIEM